MVANIYDKKVIADEINHRSADGFFEGKDIIIFGCTIFAKDIKDSLEENGIDFYAFIDNNPQKVGTSCMGKMIYSPEELFAENRKTFLVIIASKYHCEMRKQLVELGMDNSQIIDISVRESNTFVGDSEETLNVQITDAERGIQIIQEIQNKYSNIEKAFLCPYPGTGDIYMACGYLPEYLRSRNIQRYVLIVIGKNCEKVARLFEVQNIEVISEDESRLLLESWEFYGTQIVNLKPLLHWGWRTKKYLFPNNHPQITFSKMFKYDVFELSESAVFSHPHFSDDVVYAESLFERIGLKKGKTIILAPYANSYVSNIPQSEWEDLVKCYEERGFTVCTNCFGINEKPINGTKAIQFPYEKAKCILEYAGYFIGIRSGLCDIISSVKCQVIIIYEGGFNASSITYFGLKNMGLKMDAIEYIYKDTTLSELIGDII